MAHKVACFLLRKEMLPLLEHVHYKLLPEASLHEGDDEKPIARFAELVKEALRWEIHARDWYLHGALRGKAVPPVLKIAHRDDVSYLDGWEYLEGLSQLYAWSLVPWGVYGTGQMLIFISSDEEVFTKVMKYFAGGSHDLLVSSYTAEQFREKQFRGAIFRRSTELRGKGLWEYGRGSSESVLALTSGSESSDCDLSSRFEVVCEVRGDQVSSTRQRWIRIHDGHTLVQQIANRHIVIITAAGLDERLMWLALQEFAKVADHVKKDPLSFGLRALESVPWIYIATDDDEKWEIYINQDPAVTRRLLQSKELIEGPYFVHSYFC